MGIVWVDSGDENKGVWRYYDQWSGCSIGKSLCSRIREASHRERII